MTKSARSCILCHGPVDLKLDRCFVCHSDVLYSASDQTFWSEMIDAMKRREGNLIPDLLVYWYYAVLMVTGGMFIVSGSALTLTEAAIRSKGFRPKLARTVFWGVPIVAIGLLLWAMITFDLSRSIAWMS